MSRAARLGAFIVATLAILVVGVFIIGGKQYLFSSTYQLKAQFDNVVGLDAGGDVRVGGVHSGTVHSIVLPHKPGDKVTVVMDLGKSTHEIIKQDSVATIETEGLLGNQFLAISFGSSGTADVRDGDTISSQPPLEISDLLKKTSGILDSSQQAIQNATRATANLDSISARSEEHTSELQSLRHLVCRLLLEKKKGLPVADGVRMDAPVGAFTALAAMAGRIPRGCGGVIRARAWWREKWRSQCCFFF